MLLLVYLRLYGKCLGEALKGIGKNPWTLALPMGLSLAFGFISLPLSQLGIVGGFLLGLLLDAAASCYLYFTGGTVALQKMTLGELKKSFLVYFWSVIGLFFVVWVANLLLDFVVPANAQGLKFRFALNMVAAVVLNPAPEVIYSKGTRGGMDTVMACVRFLQENWLEWFVPNLLVGASAWLLYTQGLQLMPLLAGPLALLFGGAVLHVVMVFRGHLFQELDGSTHRQRMFRYKNG